MINYRYDRFANETVVEMERFTIFSPDQFPMTIQFKEAITGKVAYSNFISPGTWVSWKGGEVQHGVLIIDAKGMPVYTKAFNVELQGDLIEKSLYFFLKRMNEVQGKRPLGMVIGPHDGTFGHWTFPVKDNLSDVVFIDGSLKQLKELEKNYKHLNKAKYFLSNGKHTTGATNQKTMVKYIHEIVTPDGAEVEWFEGGEGFTDTVNKKVISEFLTDDKITQTHRSSWGINEIIEANDCQEMDWLHLDVEGLDADLIMALEYYPKLIVFESMHMDQQQISGMLDWFQSNNYKLYNDFSNGIAIKMEIENG